MTNTPVRRIHERPIGTPSQIHIRRDLRRLFGLIAIMVGFALFVGYFGSCFSH